ncbi:MAG: sialidase family protein [Spirochaetota bacterium]
MSSSGNSVRYEKRVKELIFQGERPFSFCHASTLTLLSDGELIAAWFAGTTEGSDDTAIWSSRRERGKWLPCVKLVDDKNAPNWNPVLFQKDDRTLLLFYKAGRKISEWSTRVIVSNDGGRSWSPPRELVPGDRGGRGPVRNKILKLNEKIWIAPASVEDRIWRAFADVTEDGGITWKKSNEITIRNIDYNTVTEIKSDIPVSEQSLKGRGVIQPTLWESEPGKVHMLLRSTEGCIYRSDSIDGGRTWGTAIPTNLPNNNSGIDIVKIENGALVLVFNPVGVNWGPRTPIALMVSFDNGETWGDMHILENTEGEYSYPAIVAKNNTLYLTYTWRRKSIVYWEIEVRI